MSEKIHETHLERVACVYLRQSSMQQVHHNRESRERQYALKSRAKGLGFGRVEVIDEDLGRSGSGSEERPGFVRLVALVCAGDVGAVFALEASRLARNNRDWHHLIDLCAMTQTLVIDHDGVYEPRQLNDRLLLGLKGTMSEFELGLIRQRLQEGLVRKIKRGEATWIPSVGYIRTSEDGLEKTPDLQVQDAIRGVFDKFHELGPARQVLLWYRQNKLPLPTLSVDSGHREVSWQSPAYNRILSILKNPVYAGAFVYGRRQTKTAVVDGRTRKTAGHEVPLDQWTVLIRDHHAGYISWETYVRNQEQLQENLNKDGRNTRGSAKTGPALLAGLFRCGRCGRKLHVTYGGVGGRVQRYGCRGASVNHVGSTCISFGGIRVDRVVSEHVLDTLQEVGVESAIDAYEQLQEQESQKTRALRLALEKAQYEVDRARRQYDAIEPENRLVAGELENRWEQALEQVSELQRRLEATDNKPVPVPDAERERLLALGEDLRELWYHPQASVSIKKRILRIALQEIIADVSDDPCEIRLVLHWAGGIHSLLVVPKNRTGQHGRSTDKKVVELIHDLALVSDDGGIAAILNRLGYRTGAGNTWTEPRVRSLRGARKIPAFNRDSNRTWVNLAQAAKELEVSPTVVRRLLRDHHLRGRQAVSGAPWIIEREELRLPAVQAVVRAIREGRRSPRTVNCESQVDLFQQDSEV